MKVYLRQRAAHFLELLRSLGQESQTQSGHSERPVHFIEGLLGRKRRA